MAGEKFEQRYCTECRKITTFRLSEKGVIDSQTKVMRRFLENPDYMPSAWEMEKEGIKNSLKYAPEILANLATFGIFNLDKDWRCNACVEQSFASLEQKFIFCRKDGRCLDATWPETRVHLWTCLYAENQKWYLIRIDNAENAYEIRSVSTGRYLDVDNYSMENLALVHQWERTKESNQTWELIKNDDGSCFIKASHSGKYLSAFDEGGDGCGVVQYDFHGNNNQKWEIKKAT